MAKVASAPVKVKTFKKTSQAQNRPKMASMNKSKKRSYKKYRGQG